MIKNLLACVAVSGILATGAFAHEGHSHGGLTEGAAAAAHGDEQGRRWLSGDHHIHTEYSASYEMDPADPAKPPKILLGKDGRYSIQRNAEMGAAHGLSWMVVTDHGGPTHSKLNHDEAYPALLKSREAVPQILQFYGMEFDTPGGDHSSLIIPRTAAEREQLYDIESKWSRRDPHPADPTRDEESKMIEALRHMRGQATPPVVIANHPSRSAKDVGVWGRYSPEEFRNWNDTAPEVAVGMEGAPGHQANALNPDGSQDPEGARGGYRNSPTWGGFDQMAARLGGFWDSMLGEGRRWWITATSDSHYNWRDGGSDFWPGEYSKTYVRARADQTDILEGLRTGRVFVTTGDLVSELDVTASSGDAHAMIGGELAVKPGQDVTISIRLRDPAGANFGGRTPDVARVDLIRGDVTGPVADRTTSHNPTTQVVQRFDAGQWQRDGEVLTMTYVLKNVRGDQYVRVRGTNTGDLEPPVDPRGEDPWSDLWFYSNPIFIKIAK
ncbi:MAG: phosphoesterase [Sphingomonadaceae bacterium]